MIVQAVSWGIVFTGLLMLLIAMFFGEPETTEEKFKVVDNYKGCDVIEYSPSNAARYQYLLHCP